MKKAATLTALALVAGAVAFTSVGMAEARGGPKFGNRPDFATLDTNADGLLTHEEMAAAATARFQEQDTDGDGMISREELAAAIVKRAQDNADAVAARIIERRDTNGDGMIAADEGNRGPNWERMVERLDSDGDGAISQAEFEDAQKRFGRHKRGPGNAPAEQ